jgi:hypothetical protein
MTRVKEAEKQKFQDLLLHSCCSESLQISILPHLRVFLSSVEVAAVMSLMRQASVENAAYEDRHGHDKKNGVFVQRMKDNSSLCFGHGMVEVEGLTDTQWIAIYKAFKEWQEWSAAGGGEEWRKQIPPDRKAFAMFDLSVSESERSDLFQKTWNDIFDKTGVELS